MPSTPRKTMLRITQAEKDVIEAWKEGVHLQESTSQTVEELQHRAASDRLGLARSFLKQGQTMLSSSPSLYRGAISRFYYSMYHAMRAVVYYTHGGDDHEKHNKVAAQAPHDLPDRDLWQNTFKNARERRNNADYDPYPKADTAWKNQAADLRRDAEAFVGVARKYLKGKGCLYI